MVVLRHGKLVRRESPSPMETYFFQVECLGGQRVEWELWPVNDSQVVVTKDRYPIFSGTCENARAYVLSNIRRSIGDLTIEIQRYASEGVQVLETDVPSM